MENGVGEGVIALWRGNTANVIRYFPTQVIAMNVFDYLSWSFSISFL